MLVSEGQQGPGEQTRGDAESMAGTSGADGSTVTDGDDLGSDDDVDEGGDGGVVDGGTEGLAEGGGVRWCMLCCRELEDKMGTLAGRRFKLERRRGQELVKWQTCAAVEADVCCATCMAAEEAADRRWLWSLETEEDGEGTCGGGSEDEGGEEGARRERRWMIRTLRRRWDGGSDCDRDGDRDGDSKDTEEEDAEKEEEREEADGGEETRGTSEEWRWNPDATDFVPGNPVHQRSRQDLEAEMEGIRMEIGWCREAEDAAADELERMRKDGTGELETWSWRKDELEEQWSFMALRRGELTRQLRNLAEELYGRRETRRGPRKT